MGMGRGRPSAEGRGRGRGRDAPSPVANPNTSFYKSAWPWLWPRLLGMQPNCNQQLSAPSSFGSSFPPPASHGRSPPQCESQSTASSAAGAQEGPLGSKGRTEAPGPPPGALQASPASQIWHPLELGRLGRSPRHPVFPAATCTLLKRLCGLPTHCLKSSACIPQIVKVP